MSACVLLVWALFRFTKLGLGMRAAAVRPAAAALVGVRVDRMLAIGWGLAAVLGAVAGLMAEPSRGASKSSGVRVANVAAMRPATSRSVATVAAGPCATRRAPFRPSG